jgi:hypothetical protein
MHSPHAVLIVGPATEPPIKRQISLRRSSHHTTKHSLGSLAARVLIAIAIILDPWYRYGAVRCLFPVAEPGRSNNNSRVLLLTCRYCIRVQKRVDLALRKAASELVRQLPSSFVELI